MSDRGCPLGLCDGSGFIPMPVDEDEDNCPHVDERPSDGWTRPLVEAFLWHYNTAHVWYTTACPWCGPSGVASRKKC